MTDHARATIATFCAAQALSKVAQIFRHAKRFSSRVTWMKDTSVLESAEALHTHQQSPGEGQNRSRSHSMITGALQRTCLRPSGRTVCTVYR